MSQQFARASDGEGDIGRRLADARTTLGVSPAQLSVALLLSIRQIQGLETGDTSAFHNRSFYLKGLRKYAAHMQIAIDDPHLPAPSPDGTASRDAASVQGETSPREDGTGSLISRRQMAPLAAAAFIACSAGAAYLLSPDLVTRFLEPADTVAYPAPPPPPPQAPADPAVLTPAVPAQGTTSTSADSAPESDALDARTSTQPLSVAVAEAPKNVPGRSGRFGQLRVDAPTWVFVRYADNSTDQRLLDRGDSFPLDMRPVYLAVGVSQVALTVAGRTVDVAPFVTADREVRMGARELMDLPFPEETGTPGRSRERRAPAASR